MAPRWNEEMTLRFLELYKDRRVLWDQFAKLYKNKDARDVALDEIVSAMNLEGFGINEAKLKIKALRATYSGEIAKQVKNAESGDLYVSNIRWLPIMKYIFDEGTAKRDFKKENLDDTETLIEVYPDIVTDGANGGLGLLNSPAATFKPPSCKKTKISESEDHDERRFDDSNSSQTFVSKTTEKDICDIYGELVAAKLKAMDERTRDYCMNRIDNLLFETKTFGIPNPANSFSYSQQYPPNHS